MNTENKICQNCGTQNNNISKFCIRCGNAFTNTENTNSNMQESVVENTQTNNLEQPVQSINNNTNIVANEFNNSINHQNVNMSTNNSPLNYLMFIIAMLLKPFQAFKEEEGKLTNTKTTLILSGVVAGAMMVINLIKAMINAVFTKTMDYTTFEFKTTVDFSNLQNLDYLELIGKNLLMYAGIILAITAIYYLASLVMKKTINFIKMLAITSSSLIPFVVISMAVSPILGKLYSHLSIIGLIIGAIYSISIFITLVNENITFEKKDIQIYFHAVCLSILCVVAYFLIINVITAGITNAITGELGNYMDMFN